MWQNINTRRKRNPLLWSTVSEWALAKGFTLFDTLNMGGWRGGGSFHVSPEEWVWCKAKSAQLDDQNQLHQHLANWIYYMLLGCWCVRFSFQNCSVACFILWIWVLFGQVSASSQVSEVKDQVHTLMSIPVCDQKLLYRGKALAGQWSVCVCNVVVCYL